MTSACIEALTAAIHTVPTMVIIATGRINRRIVSCNILVP